VAERANGMARKLTRSAVPARFALRGRSVGQNPARLRGSGLGHWPSVQASTPTRYRRGISIKHRVIENPVGFVGFWISAIGQERPV